MSARSYQNSRRGGARDFPVAAPRRPTPRSPLLLRRPRRRRAGDRSPSPASFFWHFFKRGGSVIDDRRTSTRASSIPGCGASVARRRPRRMRRGGGARRVGVGDPGAASSRVRLSALHSAIARGVFTPSPLRSHPFLRFALRRGWGTRRSRRSSPRSRGRRRGRGPGGRRRGRRGHGRCRGHRGHRGRRGRHARGGRRRPGRAVRKPVSTIFFSALVRSRSRFALAPPLARANSFTGLVGLGREGHGREGRLVDRLRLGLALLGEGGGNGSLLGSLLLLVVVDGHLVVGLLGLGLGGVGAVLVGLLGSLGLVAGLAPAALAGATAVGALVAAVERERASVKPPEKKTVLSVVTGARRPRVRTLARSDTERRVRAGTTRGEARTTARGRGRHSRRVA